MASWKNVGPLMLVLGTASACSANSASDPRPSTLAETGGAGSGGQAGETNAGGATASGGAWSASGGSGGTSADPGCSAEAKHIYLVGRDVGTFDLALFRFDPAALSFQGVAPIVCPGFVQSPLVLGGVVSRSGEMWLALAPGLSESGTGGLFRLAVKDGKCSKASSVTPSQSLFGSTFSTVSAGSNAEALYVPVPFGTFDLTTEIHTPLGPTPWVHDKWMMVLAGTGNAELFGLAWWGGATPKDQPVPPLELHTLDKATGTSVSSKKLDAEPLRSAVASAFAPWGGSLWAFMSLSGSGTVVQRYDMASGKLTQGVASLDDIQVSIAGASTCAPPTIQ